MFKEYEIQKGYIFELNYAERIKEKDFILDALKQYNKNELVGAGIYVNNNPYNFQMLLYLNFAVDTDQFEEWLKTNYPEKQRRFNYFIGDIIEAISTKGYNIATFTDESSVHNAITAEPNEIFIFPDKESFRGLWNSDVFKDQLKVFLSHSSKDKVIVDKIFNELQLEGIRAWYDKYEIRPGDSIVDKINEGLDESDVGVICLSQNFLNSSTGWTKSELNFFIQKRMRSGTNNLICLNFDVEFEDLPPLVQDYRYIDMKDPNSLKVLVKSLADRAKE